MDQLFLFSVAQGNQKPRSLDIFLQTIAKQGGMSFSNNFDVEFSFPNPTSEHKDLIARFNKFGVSMNNGMSTSRPKDIDLQPGNASTILKVFCEEAQLPNVQAATGQVSGYRLGEGQVNYAHTKLYTDFQLGWMCDANMTPLKFLNAWYSFIFSEYDYDDEDIIENNSGYDTTNLSIEQLKNSAGNRNSPDRQIRLRYPSEYQCNVTIIKTEKGASAPNERGSMMYTLMDVFPYSIDAVPLSYGASQITKVTANFYYSKYSVVYNDITGNRGGRAKG